MLFLFQFCPKSRIQTPNNMSSFPIKCDIFNLINKVSLRIDVFLWIQLSVGFGYYLYYIGNRSVDLGIAVIGGACANLLTMSMLGIELYGNCKNNCMFIFVSLIIRLHRIIIVVGLYLCFPYLTDRTFYCNCFIFIIWDILKIILKTMNIIIIHRNFFQKPL